MSEGMHPSAGQIQSPGQHVFCPLPIGPIKWLVSDQEPRAGIFWQPPDVLWKRWPGNSKQAPVAVYKPRKSWSPWFADLPMHEQIATD